MQPRRPSCTGRAQAAVALSTITSMPVAALDGAVKDPCLQAQCAFVLFPLRHEHRADQGNLSGKCEVGKAAHPHRDRLAFGYSGQIPFDDIHQGPYRETSNNTSPGFTRWPSTTFRSRKMPPRGVDQCQRHFARAPKNNTFAKPAIFRGEQVSLSFDQSHVAGLD